MRLPVALELLELLATVNIPQPDRLVVRPTDKQGGIRRIETDARYRTAAIFSNVSVTGTTLRLSPPESTPLLDRGQHATLRKKQPGETKKKKLDRGKHATLGKMHSPVALELLELLARSHIPQPDAVVVLMITPAARCEHGAVERESDVVDRGTVLVL
jgi:hypothetical protein